MIMPHIKNDTRANMQHAGYYTMFDLVPEVLTIFDLVPEVLTIVASVQKR